MAFQIVLLPVSFHPLIGLHNKISLAYMFRYILGPYGRCSSGMASVRKYLERRVEECYRPI